MKKSFDNLLLIAVEKKNNNNNRRKWIKKVNFEN